MCLALSIPPFSNRIVHTHTFNLLRKDYKYCLSLVVLLSGNEVTLFAELPVDYQLQHPCCLSSDEVV
jgi:hypothetical protein